MDDRVMLFRVGVFFLATLILVAILLVLFGKMPTYVGKYPVQVEFKNAGGVTKGTPVRKSGMLVGRVTDMQLTDEDRKVLVTMEIQTGKTIYQNEVCSITRDLLGDTAVVIAPAKEPGLRHIPIETDKPLIGDFSEDPTGLKRALQGPIDTVTNTGVALTEASKKLGAAAERVENILNADAQKDVREILRDAAESMKIVHMALGDEKNQTKLAEALSKLPDTLASMNRTFAATDETLRQFTKPTGEGDDRKTPIERLVHTIEITERRLREFSESSDPNHPAAADQIKDTVDNIHEITKVVRDILERVNSNKGSLDKFLNDTELYDRLSKAARNI
jgi:phospholipid/cholesterol/gamma-HCH transport system substrate-binding protein